ncbi:MAG: hypothetical protein OFPII_22060 [Osedax symbiont Rs1]|nr:MAG: hypothetical protein OFPII_22060 [Osedax symbiont Rs1]
MPNQIKFSAVGAHFCKNLADYKCLYMAVRRSLIGQLNDNFSDL